MTRHHYVPQCILKGFCQDKSKRKLWVWDNKEKRKFLANKKDIFHEHDYNKVNSLNEKAGFEIDLEGFLADAIENPAAKILGELINKRNNYTIDDERRFRLLLLIAAQYMRTPGEFDRLTNFIHDPIERTTSNKESSSSYGSWEFPNNQLIVDLFKARIIPEIFDVATVLGRSDMYILICDKYNEFIISDNPFIIPGGLVECPSNLIVLHKIGLDNARMWLPVASDICVYLHRHPRTGRRGRGAFGGYRNVSSEGVSWVNQHEIKAARRFIACKSGNFERHLSSL